MTRSSFRARTSERGFALILALFLAILYFGMMELLMYDASRELSEARRFRAHIVALTLAENGAELAAAQMVIPKTNPPDETDWQGTISGNLVKTDAGPGKFDFVLIGEGRSAGLESTYARVYLEGTIKGTEIHILHSRHTQ